MSKKPHERDGFETTDGSQGPHWIGGDSDEARESEARARRKRTVRCEKLERMLLVVYVVFGCDYGHGCRYYTPIRVLGGCVLPLLRCHLQTYGGLMRDL